MADETGTGDLTLRLLTLSATTKQDAVGDLTFKLFTSDDNEGVTGEVGISDLTIPLFTLPGTGLSEGLGNFDVDFPLIEITLSAQGLTGQAASSDITFHPLEMSGDDFQGGLVDVDLPALTFSGAGLTGQAGQLLDEEFSSLTVSARGVQEGDNAADLSFPSLFLEATGFQEGLGQGDCQVSLFTLQSDGIAGEAGTTDLTFPVFTITSSGCGSYAGTASIILPAYVLEAAGETDLASTLASGLVDITVYTMNLSNFGVSTFTHYPFNSYCLFKGSYLGAKVDGIYLLSGQQDSDENIEVEMLQSAIGQEAFNKKGIPVIYADLETDGQFDLTIQSEDQEQSYSGVPYHAGMRLQKVKVGRGLKGRYFGVGLKNRDGAKMRVNSLEIPVDVSPARKGR